MKKYELTKEALNDLRNIFWYGVKLYGEESANKYYDGLLEKFDDIAERPFQYQSVSDLKEGYRRSKYGVNTIYYRINDGMVEIVRVIGRQNFRPLR